MALTDNGNGLSAADVAAVVGNGGGAFGNGGFWGDGSFWIIILFLFAFMGNGWGGFGNNAGGAMPYMVNNDVQRGFDQQAVIGGINGINASINSLAQGQCNGFNGVTNAITNAQYNNLQGMNSLAMSLQNCCCENRAAVADLKYTVANEACADRAAVGDALNSVLNSFNANTQRILDQICQDKIDAKNERIQALENQLNMAQLRESQTAQTAQILANNAAQTQALEQYLNPAPIPAYMVQNPNCCGNFNYGCGCGAA